MKLQAEQSTGHKQAAPPAGKKIQPTAKRQPTGQAAPAARRKGATAPRGKKSAPAAASAGLAGFSSNPFGTNKNSTLHQLYGGPGAGSTFTKNSWDKKTQPEPEADDKAISISGKAKSAPQSRLQPDQQAPFMGGEHTLPYMDAEKSAELSMEYKLTPKTTTRIVVNPQNPNSPLYRPTEQDKLVNSGGVYMDVEVQENVQLKVGGEYCGIEDRNQYGSSRNSQGVAVGVEWNF